MVRSFRRATVATVVRDRDRGCRGAARAPAPHRGTSSPCPGSWGRGKTTFVRGACRALGVTAAVTSPTFTIGHRYPGHPDVSHLDLYRFVGLSPAEWGDLEPYFDDAVVFVEWPEAGLALPPALLTVRIEHRGDRRWVELAAADGALLEGIAGC